MSIKYADLNALSHFKDKMKAEILNETYPVGSIYLSMNATNPSKYFGGTWEQISQGRCLVGVDTSDSDFDTLGKTGGSKYMQAHSHGYGGWLEWYAKGGARGIIGVGTSAGSTSTEGQGNAGNLQPYLTCYIWQRTA